MTDTQMTELQEKLYELHCHPKTHAIIAAIIGTEPKTEAYFTSKAIITSDGFMQANMVDSQGITRHQAFIGSYDDFVQNMQGVYAALELTAEERATFNQMIQDWIVIDYRS